MLLTDFKVVTAPAVEPVGVKEVKNFLKIDFENDDELIASLIVSAREWCEKYTSRAFIGQTLKAHFQEHSEIVRLPYAPIISISSVTRVREDDSTTLTVNSDYYVMGVQDKYLSLTTQSADYFTPGTSPLDNLRAWSLEVQYVAGYGYKASDVPSAIRSAIVRLASYYYENRNEVEVGTVVAKAPMGVKTLLNPYKVLFI